MFIILNILFELIVFNKIFSRYLPFMGLVDEIIFITIFILVLLNIIREYKIKGLCKDEIKIVILFLLFLFIGVLGDIIFKIQTVNIAILKDILAISKFIGMYIGALILTRLVDKDALLLSIYKRTKVYIVIIFLFSIINIFIDINMSFDIRYGLRSFQFIFPHPTYLVSTLVIFLSILMAQTEATNKKYKIMVILMLILTFRSKALVFVLAVFITQFTIKFAKDIKVRHIVLIAIVGVMFTITKIQDVFQYGYTAARPALYLVGLELADDYFPLGSGFGTFASSLSGEYYSPIYSQFGISNIMGLTREKYNYMADTFWPYIYGQCGYIGLIIFLSIIFLMYKSIKNRYESRGILPALMVLIYILIASFAEAIFTDSTGSLMFIILATYLGKNQFEIKV